MSSPNYKPIIDAVSALRSSSYFIFITVAFLIYDWFINLDKEIRCFWGFRKGPKLSAAALLYGLCRYLPIIQACFVAQSIFPMSNLACQANGKIIVVANTLYTLSPAAFSAIRIYALSPNKTGIVSAILTSILLFVPGFAVAVINGLTKLRVLPPPFNCSATQPIVSSGVATRLAVSTRICCIIGDLLVLFTTWRKTYTTYKAQSGVMKGPSLVRVMLYNGSVYFIVMTIVNIIDVILDQAPFGLLFYNFGTIVTDPLNAVLICHFLFALRQADLTAAPPSSASEIPSLNFATGSNRSNGSRSLPAFIASIGSELPTAGVHLMDPLYEDGGGAEHKQSDEQSPRENGDETGTVTSDANLPVNGRAEGAES